MYIAQIRYYWLYMIMLFSQYETSYYFADDHHLVCTEKVMTRRTHDSDVLLSAGINHSSFYINVI